MADKKNKKKGGFGKWLLIPVLALAAYLLKDCIPGFGLGGGAGDGTADSSAAAEGSAAPSATTTPSTSASSAKSAPITITVKGDRCDGKDCKEACAETLKKEGAVIVRASGGSHAVVEELEACLKEGGRKVSIASD